MSASAIPRKPVKHLVEAGVSRTVKTTGFVPLSHDLIRFQLMWVSGGHCAHHLLELILSMANERSSRQSATCRHCGKFEKAHEKDGACPKGRTKFEGDTADGWTDPKSLAEIAENTPWGVPNFRVYIKSLEKSGAIEVLDAKEALKQGLVSKREAGKAPHESYLFRPLVEAWPAIAEERLAAYQASQAEEEAAEEPEQEIDSTDEPEVYRFTDEPTLHLPGSRPAAIELNPAVRRALARVEKVEGKVDFASPLLFHFEVSGSTIRYRVSDPEKRTKGESPRKCISLTESKEVVESVTAEFLGELFDKALLRYCGKSLSGDGRAMAGALAEVGGQSREHLGRWAGERVNRRIGSPLAVAKIVAESRAAWEKGEQILAADRERVQHYKCSNPGDSLVVQYEEFRMAEGERFFRALPAGQLAKLRKEKAKSLSKEPRWKRIPPAVQEQECDSAIKKDLREQVVPFDEWKEARA